MLGEVRHEKHVMHKCIPLELYYHIKRILKMEKVLHFKFEFSMKADG